jgi:ABC-type transport system involved in cytochrome c biogenesis permease subunit
MLCPFCCVQIIIGFRWFLTTMTIYPNIWVTPFNFQQSENSRIIFVRVPTTLMSLVIYIVMVINSMLFLLTKHPFFNYFPKPMPKNFIIEFLTFIKKII